MKHICALNESINHLGLSSVVTNTYTMSGYETKSNNTKGLNWKYKRIE